MNVYNRFILNISYQSDSLREFTQKTPIPQFPLPPAPFREPHSKSTLKKPRSNSDRGFVKVFCCKLLHKHLCHVISLTADVNTVFRIIHTDTLEVVVFNR